jgi:hypothetical protein
MPCRRPIALRRRHAVEIASTARVVAEPSICLGRRRR